MVLIKKKCSRAAPHFLDFLSVKVNARVNECVMCVHLLSFVEWLLVIESNIAGKLWKAFLKLSKMNGSSFMYVSSFKSYTL